MDLDKRSYNERDKGKPLVTQFTSLPAAEADCAVLSRSDHEILESFSLPGNVTGLRQHMRLLTFWADGIVSDNNTALFVGLGIVVVAKVTKYRVADVNLPNLHIYHLPF